VFLTSSGGLFHSYSPYLSQLHKSEFYWNIWSDRADLDVKASLHLSHMYICVQLYQHDARAWASHGRAAPIIWEPTLPPILHNTIHLQHVSLKRMAVKNFNFKNPRQQAATILKIKKNRDIAWWWTTGFSSVSAVRHVEFLKQNFLTAGTLEKHVLHRRITLLEIGHTIAEISQFFAFF